MPGLDRLVGGNPVIDQWRAGTLPATAPPARPTGGLGRLLGGAGAGDAARAYGQSRLAAALSRVAPPPMRPPQPDRMRPERPMPHRPSRPAPPGLPPEWQDVETPLSGPPGMPMPLLAGEAGRPGASGNATTRMIY